MEEEDKHDKSKAYTSFKTKFWIADKLKIIKYAEEKIPHAAPNFLHITESNTILDSTGRRVDGSNQ